MKNAELPKSIERGLDWLDHRGGAEPTSDRPPLIADDLHDFMKRKIPPRETILSPWMVTQSLNMIHSWRGTGKTHVALGIAYAMASGGQFLNWTAKTPRKVLFVDGEMPASALQERLVAIIQSNDIEAGPGMLRIITPDIQELDLMPDLSTPEGQAAIDEQIEDDTCLIILDNLSALCRTGKENEGESWQAVASWALQQRVKGRSVLFVHHSGKGLQQRGTSRREDLLDAVISLRRPADYVSFDGAVFEIHFEKARHIHGDDVVPIEAKLTTGEDGRHIWTYKPVEQSTYERTIELANEGLTQKEIADELDVNKSTICRHFRQAKDEGRIHDPK